ncbi:MAG: lysozyme inhibitor LprI family protein [Bacteroidota bacterium]
MQLADRVNCDSIMSSLEQRICLNLEFQELDLIVEVKFNSLLKIVESDSLKTELSDYQKVWAKNRHNQSVIASKGYRGHMLGIVYLGTMINISRRRIEEIEYLMKN